ncbi:MAG: hypothetical protein [Cressdnaviricota sp.]|nr:MAG: hypothetical protein [Cressdnaviricota sp.]
MNLQWNELPPTFKLSNRPRYPDFKGRGISSRTLDVPLLRKRYSKHSKVLSLLKRIPLPENFIRMVPLMSMPVSTLRVVLIPLICDILTFMLSILTSPALKTSPTGRGLANTVRRMEIFLRLVLSARAKEPFSSKSFSKTLGDSRKNSFLPILRSWLTTSVLLNNGCLTLYPRSPYPEINCFLREGISGSLDRVTLVKAIGLMLAWNCPLNHKSFREITTIQGSTFVRTSYTVTNTKLSSAFRNLIGSVMVEQSSIPKEELQLLLFRCCSSCQISLSTGVTRKKWILKF